MWHKAIWKGHPMMEHYRGHNLQYQKVIQLICLSKEKPKNILIFLLFTLSCSLNWGTKDPRPVPSYRLIDFSSHYVLPFKISWLPVLVEIKPSLWIAFVALLRSILGWRVQFLAFVRCQVGLQYCRLWKRTPESVDSVFDNFLDVLGLKQPIHSKYVGFKTNFYTSVSSKDKFY